MLLIYISWSLSRLHSHRLTGQYYIFSLMVYSSLWYIFPPIWVLCCGRHERYVIWCLLRWGHQIVQCLLQLQRGPWHRSPSFPGAVYLQWLIDAEVYRPVHVGSTEPILRHHLCFRMRHFRPASLFGYAVCPILVFPSFFPQASVTNI